jgi:menaquinone-dependent protoporphyrinogen IX oxidase
MPKFPDVDVQLTGQDGNAFFIIARVSRALKDAGHRDAVDEFRREAMSGDYDHVLVTCMEYVNCH